MRGGPAKEPNSNRIGTQSQARGLDALLTGSVDSSPNTCADHGIPNRRTRGMRLVMEGEGRASRIGAPFLSRHQTTRARRAAGPWRVTFLVGSLQSEMPFSLRAGARRLRYRRQRSLSPHGLQR
jgi:hypothetical protein